VGRKWRLEPWFSADPRLCAKTRETQIDQENAGAADVICSWLGQKQAIRGVGRWWPPADLECPDFAELKCPLFPAQQFMLLELLSVVFLPYAYASKAKTALIEVVTGSVNAATVFAASKIPFAENSYHFFAG